MRTRADLDLTDILDDSLSSTESGEARPATMSSIPVSDEHATIPRSMRTEGGEGAPAEWLDRLLVATSALHDEEGEVEVARALSVALSEILQRPVGVCLIAQNGGQEIVRVQPEGEAPGGEADPARLFPGNLTERVFPVMASRGHSARDEEAFGLDGTTLHIAADDEIDPRMIHVGERAATLLAVELVEARRRTSARRTQRELSKLQAYIIQADKLASMGQLAAGVVHELNNPLTSIVAYTEYLIRKSQANVNHDPDDLERLRRIGESAGRMLRLTRDLVTYARPSSDIAVPIAIEQVLEKALAFCEHVVAEIGAKVDRQFAEVLPPVRGMPEELAQVFVNLITNACHAMTRDEGCLKVTTALEEEGGGRWVCVTLEDNGHGIDEAHLPHIFAPFFTTKSDGRGTGLGLAIVKNILDKHRGGIWAEAARSGGTRFVLRFPALDS